MYVEKRKIRKDRKYYLVHSYRDKGQVKKTRKYLGLNLSAEELEKRKQETKGIILELIEEFNTEVFKFSLTKKQIETLNDYNDQLKIRHLEHFDWRRFTEQFTYNTNAIEGSTVQLDDIPQILKKSNVQDPEEIETKGVAKTVDFIRRAKEDISRDLIKKIHKLCFEGTKHFAGEFRKVEVVIKNSRGEIVHVGAPVSGLQEKLEELVNWYQKNKFKFKPLVLAAIIHNQFEHIHPFQDGNGRVGRLLLNYVLLNNKYPPINILLEDRQEYYHSLQEYSKNDNLKPTLIFLIKQYKKTLKQVSTKDKY